MQEHHAGNGFSLNKRENASIEENVHSTIEPTMLVDKVAVSS